MKLYQTRPCLECPWRCDVPPGQFPPERFIALAETAYDRALVQFGCHLLDDVGCAGFVLRGAEHNLGARLAICYGRLDPRAADDGGLLLYQDYRAMAVANGVPPDHPALKPCREGGKDDQSQR